MHSIRWISKPADWAAQAKAWDAMAAKSPCQRFSWLYRWWQSFGKGRQLAVGVLEDASGRWVAALPCFGEIRGSHGMTLRLLGSGSACSDFVGLLARPGWESRAAQAFADDLLQRHAGLHRSWQLIDWDGVSGQDDVTLELIRLLGAAGCRLRESGCVSTWRLPLKSTFEEQIAACGQGTRRKLKRIRKRLLETSEISLRSAETPEQAAQGLEILVDLHQRRRTQLGEPGCFHETHFRQFFLNAARDLFEAGAWKVDWVERKGTPIAAEAGFFQDDTFFMYQSGFSPEHQELEPGWIIKVGMLLTGIEQGWSAIDYMRGDERYKKDLRAEPTRCLRFRISNVTLSSRTRFAALGLALDAKSLWQNGFGAVTQ